MADQLTQDQIANMSDEEVMNLDLDALAFNSSKETEQETTTTTEDSPKVEGGDKDEGQVDPNNAEQKADDDEQEQAEENVEGDDAEAGEGGNPETDGANDPKNTAQANDGKGEKAQKDEPANGKPAPAPAAPATVAAPDLTDFHAKITAPFKANGREMQVKDADEAIQLMQMGANYNKKMAGLKPNLTLMKMLQKADLLSEEKISFLIDVASKKPEAISKLVKDAGIDPLDISDEKAGDYTPGNHRITDEEQALDEVFDALEGKEGFDRTLDVIGKQWDAKSRSIIAQNPKALVDITQHIAAGVFDEVVAKVERERVLGRLTGLSDLEAYRQVGTAMAESGELKHLSEKATPTSQPAAPAKVVAEQKPKKADDANRRAQRQAASPSRAAAPSNKDIPADFNPLSMSDEEIMKMDFSKFK